MKSNQMSCYKVHSNGGNNFPPRTPPPPPVTGGIPEAEAGPHAKRFLFNNNNFTQIPNDLFNLVLDGKLLPRDLPIYAYLLGKWEIAKLRFQKDYTIIAQKTMCKELSLSQSTIKAAIKNLCNAGIIEQLDTPGFTRKRVLVFVKNNEVVRSEPKYSKSNRKSRPDDKEDDPFAVMPRNEEAENPTLGESPIGLWESCESSSPLYETS